MKLAKTDPRTCACGVVMHCRVVGGGGGCLVCHGWLGGIRMATAAEVAEEERKRALMESLKRAMAEQYVPFAKDLVRTSNKLLNMVRG